MKSDDMLALVICIKKHGETKRMGEKAPIWREWEKKHQFGQNGKDVSSEEILKFHPEHFVWEQENNQRGVGRVESSCPGTGSSFYVTT